MLRGARPLARRPGRQRAGKRGSLVGETLAACAQGHVWRWAGKGISAGGLHVPDLVKVS